MSEQAVLKKELIVSIANKVGVLADISKIIAHEGINILAINGYALTKDKAIIRFVSEDNSGALKILKRIGYGSVKQGEVLVVELDNSPGALREMAGKLANSRIDIKFIYGTACKDGCPASIVLSTSNNKKAKLVLSK
ncbi:MAG: ACT domain-containing protein [Candidatus Omnitrophica bacterium]|nr:ACT domain-containing protein [Candidatus Omnitrophota bacterium]